MQTVRLFFTVASSIVRKEVILPQMGVGFAVIKAFRVFCDPDPGQNGAPAVFSPVIQVSLSRQPADENLRSQARIATISLLPVAVTYVSGINTEVTYLEYERESPPLDAIIEDKLYVSIKNISAFTFATGLLVEIDVEYREVSDEELALIATVDNAVLVDNG